MCGMAIVILDLLILILCFIPHNVHVLTGASVIGVGVHLYITLQLHTRICMSPERWHDTHTIYKRYIIHTNFWHDTHSIILQMEFGMTPE